MSCRAFSTAADHPFGLEQGYQIATKLAQANPNLDGVDYALGRSAEVMGQLRERIDAKAAYNYYSQAHTALGKCLTKNAKDLDCLKREFMVLGRIGNMLFDAKQYGDALSASTSSGGGDLIRDPRCRHSSGLSSRAWSVVLSASRSRMKAFSCSSIGASLMPFASRR